MSHDEETRAALRVSQTLSRRPEGLTGAQGIQMEVQWGEGSDRLAEAVPTCGSTQRRGTGVRQVSVSEMGLRGGVELRRRAPAPRANGEET